MNSKLREEAVVAGVERDRAAAKGSVAHRHVKAAAAIILWRAIVPIEKYSSAAPSLFNRVTSGGRQRAQVSWKLEPATFLSLVARLSTQAYGIQ